MKRIIKLKERPAASKKGLTQKRRFLKGIRKHKKKYTQINAPHNTSQYLIENNSSPFYEDDDDTNVDCIPSSLIILDDSDDFMIDDSIYQKNFHLHPLLGKVLMLILLFQVNRHPFFL